MKNAHIKEILDNARKKTYNAINFAMVEAYWEIGKSIVEMKVEMKLLNMVQSCEFCFQRN
jgi:hypothetical protein